MAAEAAYALVQAVHNFGAVAVVGSPAAAWLWLREQRVTPDTLAWLTLSGWLAQALSGGAFGVTSYLSRGELPEITGIALIALYIKVVCAISGVALLAVHLAVEQSRRERMQSWLWVALFAAGCTALASAAFLRWFG